jgi:uncharacterized HAD superfamily protein
MNFRSIADMDRAIANNLWKLDRYKFDVIVGIPRSGMIPASILATYLQLPLSTPEAYVAGIVHGRSGKVEKGRERVLLVDDTSNKGGAMARAIKILNQRRPAAITRCAVYGPYQVPIPELIIDVWFEDCKGPRGFAWNLWKHARLRRWGFDFDGVLCRDPTRQENDDGTQYQRFLKQADPLFIPTRPLGHIITGRLEKYRGECTDWLRRHGIEYEQLHMMPFADKAERMAHGGRGKWKAGIARTVGVEMFIESCPKQAGIIAREAQIPVWCTGTQSLA